MADNIVWQDHKVVRSQRAENKNQKPCLLWFTGLSGSGKSTIANALDVALHSRGRLFPAGEFIEVYMDSPYEEPPHPEIRLDTSSSSVDSCVTSLIDYLLKRKLIAD